MFFLDVENLGGGGVISSEGWMEGLDIAFFFFLFVCIPRHSDNQTYSGNINVKF